MVTSENDIFIVYQYDKYRFHHWYTYDIYEKIHGKPSDKKVRVLNVGANSVDRELTKNDFFNTCIKYKYKNKKVKAYLSKDQYYIIFKVEGQSNYKWIRCSDILLSYEKNNYSDYEYLPPIYIKFLKTSDPRYMSDILVELLLFDVTESFPLIKQKISTINNNNMKNDVLKYIKDYPSSKKYKDDLINKIIKRE